MFASGRWPPFARRRWSLEEDDALISAVAKHGVGRWDRIAACVGSRRDWQCCERWRNQLSPQISKEAWKAEEDQLIRQHVRLSGQQWSRIAGFLPGRTGNSIKNRFKVIARRELSTAAGEGGAAASGSVDGDEHTSPGPLSPIAYRDPRPAAGSAARRAPALALATGASVSAGPLGGSACALPRMACDGPLPLGAPLSPTMPTACAPVESLHDFHLGLSAPDGTLVDTSPAWPPSHGLAPTFADGSGAICAPGAWRAQDVRQRQGQLPVPPLRQLPEQRQQQAASALHRLYGHSSLRVEDEALQRSIDQHQQLQRVHAEQPQRDAVAQSAPFIYDEASSAAQLQSLMRLALEASACDGAPQRNPFDHRFSRPVRDQLMFQLAERLNLYAASEIIGLPNAAQLVEATTILASLLSRAELLACCL